MTLGSHLHPATQDIIKREPMVHRATSKFALENGGPLTREFLTGLFLAGSVPVDDILIDSRVHMLMPGMYPCIPGFHHDDVPRERSDGQPNYVDPSYFSRHCMALWGDCSLTEFAIGEHDFSPSPLGQKIYKEWSPKIETLCDGGVLQRAVAPEAQLVFFNAHSWHKGSPTTHHGFRFFIRATWDSKLSPKNEIRFNANTYMPVLEEGW